MPRSIPSPPGAVHTWPKAREFLENRTRGLIKESLTILLSPDEGAQWALCVE
jgi:hypothetical protein